MIPVPVREDDRVDCIPADVFGFQRLEEQAELRLGFRQSAAVVDQHLMAAGINVEYVDRDDQLALVRQAIIRQRCAQGVLFRALEADCRIQRINITVIDDRAVKLAQFKMKYLCHSTGSHVQVSSFATIWPRPALRK